MKKSSLVIMLVLFACGIIVFSAGCEKLFPTRSELPNSPPNTTIANVPVANDTLYALVGLFWDGEDFDGYIDGYQYRYTTYYLEAGQAIEDVAEDSIITQEWSYTTETSLTIAFNSHAQVNYQFFEISAIDNSGNIDPTPASRTFFTTPTLEPETWIDYPIDKQEFFAKEAADDWWQGIPLRYGGQEIDGGRIVEYAWSVDDTDWFWTTDTAVTIPPEFFSEPLNGVHVIRVMSRDDTNLYDSEGDSITITLWVPTWEEDILIVDETEEATTLPDNGWVTDANVDDFYFDVFGGNRGDLIVTNQDYFRRRLPSRKNLGKYKMIVWHADDYVIRPGLPEQRELITDYLNMGGKLVYSGSRTLNELLTGSDWNERTGWIQPIIFSGVPEEDFIAKYLHIRLGYFTKEEGNMEKAVGINGFTAELVLDPNKVDSGFPSYGRLGEVWTVVESGGFTVGIMDYVGTDEKVAGYPCAIRYYGSVFDIVFMGFPLWHFDYAGAKQFGDEILESMGF